MTLSKLSVSIGSISFAGEGAELWLSEQFDKLLDALSRVEIQKIKNAVPENRNQNNLADDSSEEFGTALATYIKEKNADGNQNKRFLVTADWLRRRGQKDLKTALVTKALSDNHQKRLSNPADCLNQNTAKGFTEKRGGSFFITPEGLKELGHS
jgi:hypothetical protein